MPQVLKILLQVQQTLEAVSLLSWQRPNFQMCISGAYIVAYVTPYSDWLNQSASYILEEQYYE